MSTNLRRLKHENVTAKFDANRGAEGQIKARKNAKGEVELVAFFGGKWFYCPMAEFNQTLNLRHGAQVNGSDIMTATQKDSSGFSSVRLDVTSKELPPKLNECKIFVDIIPATSAITKNFVLTNGSKQIQAFANGATSTIVAGLNAIDVAASKLPDDTFITAVNRIGDGATSQRLLLNQAATATDSNQQITFQTRDTSYPNAFLNFIYKDGADTYYHKFQLNTTTLTPFEPGEQATEAGSVGGAGGSGTFAGGTL